MYLSNRAGPEACSSGGVIHGNQVYQRGVPEWSGTCGQWLSRWSHSSQSSASLPLLSTWTLLEVIELSSAVCLEHTDVCQDLYEMCEAVKSLWYLQSQTQKQPGNVCYEQLIGCLEGFLLALSFTSLVIVSIAHLHFSQQNQQFLQLFVDL